MPRGRRAIAELNTKENGCLVGWFLPPQSLPTIKGVTEEQASRLAVLNNTAIDLYNFDGQLPSQYTAQRFAEAVLLSRKAVEEELRGFEHTWLPMPLLEDIKQRYSVSIRTIIFRAGHLGIISKTQMGQQVGIINREYGFEDEPGEDIETKALELEAKIQLTEKDAF